MFHLFPSFFHYSFIEAREKNHISISISISAVPYPAIPSPLNFLFFLTFFLSSLLLPFTNFYTTKIDKIKIHDIFSPLKKDVPTYNDGTPCNQIFFPLIFISQNKIFLGGKYREKINSY